MSSGRGKIFFLTDSISCSWLLFSEKGYASRGVPRGVRNHKLLFFEPQDVALLDEDVRCRGIGHGQAEQHPLAACSRHPADVRRVDVNEGPRFLAEKTHRAHVVEMTVGQKDLLHRETEAGDLAENRLPIPSGIDHDGVPGPPVLNEVSVHRERTHLHHVDPERVPSRHSFCAHVAKRST